MYRDAREQAGMSREEAAFRLHIGTRTLAYYEAGERAPGPDVVLEMSREYRLPDLTLKYCREYCSIGQVYSYESLDNVDTSLPAIILKLIEETEEAREMLNRLMKTVINKRTRKDYNESDWRELQEAVLEFIDVEHAIEVLKISLGNLIDIPNLIAMHNQKCHDHGYVKEKAPAFAAAR